MPRFAPAAVALLESDVREFAASLVDGVANTGRADLYETLAKPLPFLMITRLLGIERDDLFWEWVELLMYGRVEGADPATIVATAEALYDFLARQLELRRAAPGDDLLSLLLRATSTSGPTPRTRFSTSRSSWSSPGSRTRPSRFARRSVILPFIPMIERRSLPTRP